MNQQEVFDRVVEHLATQGHQSQHLNGGCAYRGKGGTSCAVGILITDEFYVGALEGRVSCEEQVVNAVTSSLKTDLSKSDVGLLVRLQNAHDDSANLFGVVNSLSETAKDFNLSPDKVELIKEWSA